MFSCVDGEPQPAMYDIRSADDGTTLIIKIRAEIWPNVLSLLQTSPYRFAIERSLRIPPFLPPSALPWGFGPVFMEELADEHWYTIRCELPCFFNRSRENDSSWTRAFGVSASIHWLLQCAIYAKDKAELSANFVQLLEVNVGSCRDPWGTSCYISAGFSSQICQWIRRQDSERLCAEITRCMTNAYLRLYGKDGVDTYDVYHLGARIHEPSRIVFNCPGDRCSLYPLSSPRPGSGYEFCDHNVDSPMQQLVLLMGVASLATCYYATP